MARRVSFRIAGFAALLLASACHGDRTQGLDANPSSPEVLEFGLLAVGGSKTLALPINNLGSINLNVNQVRLDEPFGLAQIPDPVEPGAEGTALVTFAPIAPGETMGQAVIVTSSISTPILNVRLHGVAYSPTLTASPSRLDFGDVEVGSFKTLPVTVTNGSPVALDLSVNVAALGDFTVSPAGEIGSIAPHAGQQVMVTFAPTVAGAREGGLLIACPVCSTLPFELSGNGIAKPVPTVCTLQADPLRLDYGPLDPGQSQHQTVTLKSTGNGPCHVSAPYFAPDSDSSFNGTFAALDLASGQSATLDVAFSPTAATPLRVNGGLVLVSNNASDGPTTISLGGVVNAPAPPPPPPGKLQVTPASLTFSSQVPNAPAAQQITLANTGGSALSWQATDDDARMHLAAPASGTLAPGQTATVAVTVDAPAAAGSRSQKITVSAGAAGSALVPVTITASAAPPPPPTPAALTVSPLSLTYAAEIGTAPSPQAITIGNSGGLDLTWTAAADDATITVAPGSGTVHGGSSVFATIALGLQGVAGTRTQTVNVDAGAAGSATVTLTIVIKQTAPPPPPPQYGASVWPKFHHDNGNTGLSTIDTSNNKGVARKVKLSTPAPCKSLSGVWRCGTYQASPSLGADGTIFQVGGDGNVYAVDPTTLGVKWKTPVGEPMLASAESDITVVKSGHFFVHAHGTGADLPQFFKILDEGTKGTISWQNTPAGYDSFGKRIDGFDSAPAIDYDGNLYLMNEDASKVGSWNQTAKKLFDLVLSPKTSNNFTHGAALTTDRVAFWTSGGSIWALDENAHTVAWSAQDPALSVAGVQTYAKNAPMITSDGKVIASLGWRQGSAGAYQFYSRLTAYDAKTTKKQLWSVLIGPTKGVKGVPPLSANVSADEELRYNLGVSSPAQGPDGTIYLGHADGLYAIDPVKHSVKWAYGTGSVVSSPAVGADGTVYFGSMDGYLYAVKNANLVWQVKAGGQVNSSPAIGADGSVYAMSDDGYLYAVK